MTCTGTYLFGIMNPELERRKEFERRKKLRLLQVRQQSKEFADKLRGRIKGEIIQQKKKYLEAENKLKQEKHLQELCQLKELYDRCLESIGEGHKEAAKQPDLNLEKEAELVRISERASKRGTKAIKQKLENEGIQKQKIEAPVRQKKATRNKENLRAFFISSLPKHAENSARLSISPPKSSHQNAKPQETRRVLEEIPSNLGSCELRLRDSRKEKSPEKLNDLKKDSKGQEKEQSIKHRLTEVVVPADKAEDCLSNVSSPKDCSCDYIVCSCHKCPGELKRCSSESRISSEKVLDFEEPRKKKERSRSCSPRSVRTLNYLDCGNVYESNQQSCVRVTHHSRSPKRTEEEPESSTLQEVPVSKPSIEELKKRTDERSAKALRKEQLKRDFQHLIQNLKKLTQEKSVISCKGKLRVFSSERDILTRNETKQKKLNDAFEKLPHSLKSSKTQSKGVRKPNRIPADDSSPPTLNLALCQANMSAPTVRRVVSTDEITITGSPTTTSSKRSKGRPKSSQPSSRGRSESPEVVVNRDPSGDVHITVKVSEVLGHRPKSPSPTSTTGSSYLSPPPELTPSQQRIIDQILDHIGRLPDGDEIRNHIKQLLSMSWESIENLRNPGKPHSSRPRSPRPPTSRDADIERDLVKLDHLATVYAAKVDKLVSMYEQMSPPSTPSYVDPIRAPPRETPPSARGATPRSTRATSPLRPRQGICPTPGPAPPTRAPPPPRPRQGICPAPGQANPTRAPPPPQPRFRQDIYPAPAAPTTRATPPPRPRQGICPSPTSPPPTRATPGRSSGYGRISQPRYIPRPPGPGPDQIQEALGRHYHPERPQIGRGISYISSFPIPCSPWGTPHIPPVAPPHSAGSRIPIAVGRPPRGACSPPAPPPQPYARPLTPLKRPPQPPVHHPIPQRPQPTRARPQVTLPPDPCPQPTRGLQTSSESLGDDTLELIFGGIPGVAVPTREELEERSRRRGSSPPAAPPPDDWDMEGYFNDMRQRILQVGAEPSGPAPSPVDMSLDLSALQFPLNPQKLTAVRQKLADICIDQYRQMLEELQQDTSADQAQLEDILHRATSDPFLDPDATLGHISPGAASIPTPRGTQASHSLAFSVTGITPPVDRRLPRGPRDQGADSSAGTGSPGPNLPSWLTTEEPQDTSNIRNMLFLAKSQDRFDNSQCT